MVTFRGNMHLLNTLTSQHEFGIGLASLWNLDFYLSFQGTNINTSSQNCLSNTDRCLGVNISSFSNKVIIWIYQHLDQQVSAWCTRISFGPLSGQSQIHSIINTGRCVDGHLSLLDFNLSRLLIQYLISQIDILLCSKDCFFKAQSHMHLQIRSSSRSPSTSGTSTKKGIKQFFRINLGTTSAAATRKMKTAITKIKSTKRISTATTATKWIALLKVGICSSMTKLIVHFALLIITQYFIRFRHLLELVGSCDIVLVGIGVVFLGQLEISLLDFCLVSRFWNTQELIKIFLAVGRKDSSSGGEGGRNSSSSRTMVDRRIERRSSYSSSCLHQQRTIMSSRRGSSHGMYLLRGIIY
mmetsp:Transcript_111478/g.311632  ORF Transcript_111478/g.311632 Transcript_111478/m.311632 type:complete len:355 (-) Transcript_111478:176-1240(-)